jgi:hypothetical protein
LHLQALLYNVRGHKGRYAQHTMTSLMLSLFLSCAGGETPTEALGWREQWEIMVLTEDGGLIEGTATVGNTGMLRGAGHFRARRWFKEDAPILFEMDGSAADVDVGKSHDAVRIGSALIGRFEEGEHWSLRFSHEEANAIVRIDPGGPQPPMATGLSDGGQWTVASPISNGRTHGWFTAGRRGGIFEGQAVTLHRGGDGQPKGGRQTAVIAGRGVSIGLDLQGDQRLAWARVGDIDLPLDTTALTIRSDGSASIDFRPSLDLVIPITPSRVGGEIDTLAHLTAPERKLASAVGMSGLRQIHRGHASFSLDGTEYRAAAVTVVVD